jgi:acetyltransferase
VNSTPRLIIEALQDSLAKTVKTVIPVLMADRDETFGLDKLKELKLPVFNYPETAVKALAKMWQYTEIQNQFSSELSQESMTPISGEILRSAANSQQTDIADIFQLLSDYKIPAAPYKVSTQLRDILNFQNSVGGPIVLKTANAQIIHKSDEGLLKLNLTNSASVTAAFNEIAAKVKAILTTGDTPLFLAQQQLNMGIELVLGGKRDPQFGAVLMVGFGGIFIEVLKDVVFRVAPLSPAQAMDLLDELKAQVLLDGFRGQPAVDRKIFAETISNFSRLLYDHPEILEMDLNPLIWSEEAKAAVVVDARATIKK